MSGRSEAADTVHRAADLVDRGDRLGARGVLGESLAADQDYGPAWRWLAAVVDDDADFVVGPSRSPLTTHRTCESAAADL